MNHPKKSIEKDCATILAYIVEQGEVTREQITEHFRKKLKLSVPQIKRRITKLSDDKLIHYVCERWSRWWRPGVNPNPKPIKVKPVPRVKPVYRPEFSDLPIETRRFAGYR